MLSWRAPSRIPWFSLLSMLVWAHHVCVLMMVLRSHVRVSQKSYNLRLSADLNADQFLLSNLTRRTNIGNGVELRIFPLGDSITNGFQSSDNNGYRGPLQQDLAGSKVLFVGSKQGGTMDDSVCRTKFQLILT